MAVDGEEGIVEKVKEFFTQTPEDRAYEDAGGDDRVPEAERTDNPEADANKYAVEHGEDKPYPDIEEQATEAGTPLTEPNPAAEAVVIDTPDGPRV
jgi:hypothetical protein